MEEVKELATPNDSLLACCLCRSLLQEAVQLTCLHNCCRRCFNATVSQGSSLDVACSACGTITRAGTEQANGFIEREVRRYAAIRESKLCGVCRGNGEADKPASVWCSECRQSLCDDCMLGHRQYFRQHVAQPLEELKSLDAVSLEPPATSVCPTHMRTLDIACLNCEQAKCIICWADCKEMKHEMHIVGNESFGDYVGKFVACIASMESELLRKSVILKKPKNNVKDTQAARALHLRQIDQRKRRIVDAAELAYQQIECLTKDAYDNLEKEAHAACADADGIKSNLADARNYIRKLVESNDQCEILNQQKVVRERLRVLSAELDSLSDKLDVAATTVIFDQSLPSDLVNVIQTWIGMPQLISVAASSSPRFPVPQQHFSFSTATASVQLPVQCWDVALTKDGRLLLAAPGLFSDLIEFCSETGRELSRWQPPKPSSRESDSVLSVAALGDGLAAVGVLRAKAVVLLRRNKEGGSDEVKPSDPAWIEDRRLDQLQWPPQCLSAHGDVLAVSDGGRRLQLLSVSSGQPLCTEQRREYAIGSLAVTDRMIVTASSGKVELSGGRKAYVLDAHSLAASDGERLWRHDLSSDDEDLWGICADSTGGCLYAAVQRLDGSNGRVLALSLVDGSELRRVALSFDGPKSLLPARLSLSDDGGAGQQQSSASGRASRCSSSSSSRTVLLAALCCEPATKQLKTVTVHYSRDD